MKDLKLAIYLERTELFNLIASWIKQESIKDTCFNVVSFIKTIKRQLGILGVPSNECSLIIKRALVLYESHTYTEADELIADKVFQSAVKFIELHNQCVVLQEIATTKEGLLWGSLKIWR